MDRSLHGWAEMFDKIHMPSKKGKYDTNICADFSRIEEFGLPTYYRILTEPREFIENYCDYEGKFKCHTYYAQVYPQIIGLKKYNIMNFSNLSNVIPFLNQNISGCMDKYILLISEFEENIYGGSIMSNGRKVLIDMVHGLQNQISYGNVATHSCIVRDNGDTFFKQCGSEEKQLFFEVLDSISILGNSKKQWYLEGYFEFAFTKSFKSNALRLVFFDYKPDPKFYM